jgi:hypothetical protein
MRSPCCLCVAPVTVHRLSEQGATDFHVTNTLIITGTAFYKFAVNLYGN